MSDAAIQPLTSAIALDTAGAPPKPAIVVGERSIKNENGSVTTPLLYPVRSEGAQLSSITMRRATVKELRVAEGLSGVGSVSMMVQQLAALAPSTVDQIDAEDFGELGEVISSFLPKGRRTGAASA
ncbi:MAG TPA: phage tail assembly protein [Aliidongia sp.]|uniref:phage tail assembly protein n=1 Tax=Aliidongia sp. TaxID=1914230 RepID=UPI002DDCE4F6|nr:phage tail assembly protein [Aliidongia sp.]HEV2675279.1 phage tail assembly protein [Aliidongia sp.]